eukprot:gene10110-biopygen6170
MTELNSVLQDGGRSSLRPAGRRTEIEDGGQDGARFLDPRTEDGAVLRFRPPGRRTGTEDGGQDGGRFSDPGRNLFRRQIPSFRTEDGPGGKSVLRPPGRNISSAPSSRAEDGNSLLLSSVLQDGGRSCHPPPE